MGCGCGGQKKQYQATPGMPRGVARAQVPVNPVVVNRPIQRKCPKCSWPLNGIKRFDQVQSKQMQVWACMNRKCMYREENWI